MSESVKFVVLGGSLSVSGEGLVALIEVLCLPVSQEVLSNAKLSSSLGDRVALLDDHEDGLLFELGRIGTSGLAHGVTPWLEFTPLTQRPQNVGRLKALRTGLGVDVFSPCWAHHEINIARLVRHALSHNGGRETLDLKKQNHRIELIGNELQIVPRDNLRMLEYLQKAVDELVRVTVTHPKFMTSAKKLPQPSLDE